MAFMGEVGEVGQGFGIDWAELQRRAEGAGQYVKEKAPVIPAQAIIFSPGAISLAFIPLVAFLYYMVRRR